MNAFFKSLKSEHGADNLIFLFLALTFMMLPVATSLPLITIACAFAVSLFSGHFFKTLSIIKERWFWPALVFMVLPVIGLLYSKNPELGIDYALKIKYWIAVFLTAGIELNRNRIKMLLFCFWSSLLAGGLLAFFQFTLPYLGLPSFAVNEFLGFGLVYTVLSMYLLMGMLTASHSYRNSPDKNVRAMLLFLILVFFFHLAVLSGRNGYFVFALVLPLIVDNLFSRTRMAIKVGFAVVIVGALVLSPVVQKRIADSLEFLKQTDVILEGKIDKDFPRPFMFRSAVTLFLDHPVAGIGTGSLTYYTSKMGHTVHHPHNNILYMAVSFGIFGLMSILWLFGRMALTSWANRSTPLGYLTLSICLCIFFGGIFDTLILNSGTSLLLPMGYGFLNHMEHGRTSEN